MTYDERVAHYDRTLAEHQHRIQDCWTLAAGAVHEKNELAKAHGARLAALEDENADLKARVAALEIDVAQLKDWTSAWSAPRRSDLPAPPPAFFIPVVQDGTPV